MSTDLTQNTVFLMKIIAKISKFKLKVEKMLAPHQRERSSVWSYLYFITILL